ncbi:MAG TPA: histidine phosphatase family protein [Longimicrobiaceae bacterium]|nr:histidine phosphatase family protein [Longimicrobiaceae bacterium]
MGAAGTSTGRIAQPRPGPEGESVYPWSDLALRAPLQARNSVEIHLFRHGESEANAQGLITGQLDSGLTECGRTQASALGAALRKRYDYAWSSHLKRSIETLDLAMATAGASCSGRHIDRRLSERSLGVWEGQKRRVVPQYAQGSLSFAPPQGESYLRLTQRILSFLVDLARFSHEVDRPLTVLVSTHAGPLRVFYAILQRIPEPREVLSLEFGHCQPVVLTLSRLDWPPFVQKGAWLDEPGLLSPEVSVHQAV